MGASTTGSLGSSPPGEVATFSSTGLTNDGRIKPEIVAPGILVCSARVTEATLIQGETCSTATHDDGTTAVRRNEWNIHGYPVVAGASALVRQFLRLEGVSEPRSDLIRAILINGAEDIGVSDIPILQRAGGNYLSTVCIYFSFKDMNVMYDYTRNLPRPWIHVHH